MCGAQNEENNEIVSSWIEKIAILADSYTPENIYNL